MAKNAQEKSSPREFYKDFDGWAELSKKLDENQKMPTIREGEVWWCSIGANIGVEICGKGDTQTRPVIIMKKLSKHCFMGVPLTTKEKIGSWYMAFGFLGKRETAVVGQARVMSVSRLHSRMGQIPKTDFDMVKERFIELYR